MKQLLSPTLVKQSLAGHSWLGVMAGALMYLICLSGALAVFHHEWERWEQPTIAEGEQVPAAALQQAYNEAVSRMGGDVHDVIIGLPVKDSPRTVIVGDGQAWFVHRDGSLGADIQHAWAEMVADLHVALHLPHLWGMVVVSIFGVLLCGLIVSGFLSHPRIFRDAFTLRCKGQSRLEQVDIHNRLSVWGAPFHLMIAITGAFFGLAQLLGLLVAMMFYQGDSDQLMADLFGAPPTLEQPLQNAAVGRALQQMAEIAPDYEPFYITVEDVGKPEQYILIGAEVPGRLIFAEQYRFTAAGEYLDHAGFSDGEAGQQFIFSIYRMHFGHFGGLPMKFLFLLGGLALSIVSVSGINIWLHKRKHRDALNNIWVGIVWGTPLALALTALVDMWAGAASVALFWLTLVVAAGLAQRVNDDRRSRCGLQLVTVLLLVAVVVVHGLMYGVVTNGAAMSINAGLLISAVLLGWWARVSYRRTPAVVNAADYQAGSA